MKVAPHISQTKGLATLLWMEKYGPSNEKAYGVRRVPLTRQTWRGRVMLTFEVGVWEVGRSRKSPNGTNGNRYGLHAQVVDLRPSAVIPRDARRVVYYLLKWLDVLEPRETRNSSTGNSQKIELLLLLLRDRFGQNVVGIDRDFLCPGNTANSRIMSITA